MNEGSESNDVDESFWPDAEAAQHHKSSAPRPFAFITAQFAEIPCVEKSVTAAGINRLPERVHRAPTNSWTKPDSTDPTQAPTVHAALISMPASCKRATCAPPARHPSRWPVSARPLGSPPGKSSGCSARHSVATHTIFFGGAIAGSPVPAKRPHTPWPFALLPTSSPQYDLRLMLPFWVGFALDAGFEFAVDFGAGFGFGFGFGFAAERSSNFEKNLFAIKHVATYVNRTSARGLFHC